MAQKRILLIDDADETRNFLAESVLSPEGYEILTAASAKEALAILHHTVPDLIISDFLMPEMTGLELLQSLRSENRNIPFILITAEGSESLAVKALRLGVRDYFIKPFDIDDLLNAIKRVLHHTTAPQELTAHLDYTLWHVDDVIIITNEEQKLIFYNEAANIFFDKRTGGIHGLPLHEITSHSELLTLFSDEKIRPFLKRCEISLDAKHTYNVHLTSVPGEGYVVIMRDISYNREQDRAKGEFINRHSLNLRSPLTAIQGYTELLRQAGDMSETQKKYVQRILDNVKFMSGMLDDLFEVTQTQTEADTTLEYIPLDVIVQYAIESVQDELSAKKQTLTTEFAPLLLHVIGNPIRLKQMIVHMLQNASRYTPVMGNIHVLLYSDEKAVILQVRDAASKYADYLGLSIVKNIVEAHNGRMWVDSVPNQGTVFTVILPGSKPKYEQ